MGTASGQAGTTWQKSGTIRHGLEQGEDHVLVPNLHPSVHTGGLIAKVGRVVQYCPRPTNPTMLYSTSVFTKID